jgi:hypothetical protein
VGGGTRPPSTTRHARVIVSGVTGRDKLVAQLLAGRSDHNISFDSLCELLRWLGFGERINGSHHIFARNDVIEIVNLQPLPSGKAKRYQVKQVREIIVRYRLVGEPNES